MLRKVWSLVHSRVSAYHDGGGHIWVNLTWVEFEWNLFICLVWSLKRVMRCKSKKMKVHGFRVHFVVTKHDIQRRWVVYVGGFINLTEFFCHIITLPTILWKRAWSQTLHRPLRDTRKKQIIHLRGGLVISPGVRKQASYKGKKRFSCSLEGMCLFSPHML
jgi:hypothetical protein